MDPASELLTRIGAPTTPEMVHAVNTWFRVEGGPPTNPLNMRVNGSFPSYGNAAIAAAANLINRGYSGIVAGAKTGNPNAFLGAIARSPWEETNYAAPALNINPQYYPSGDPRAGQLRATQGTILSKQMGIDPSKWPNLGTDYLLRANYGFNPNANSPIVAAAATSPAISQQSVPARALAMPTISAPVTKLAQTAARYTTAVAVDRQYVTNLQRITQSTQTSSMQKETAAGGIAKYTARIATYTAKAASAVQAAAKVTTNYNAAKSASQIAASRTITTAAPKTTPPPKTVTKAGTNSNRAI